MSKIVSIMLLAGSTLAAASIANAMGGAGGAGGAFAAGGAGGAAGGPATAQPPPPAPRSGVLPGASPANAPLTGTNHKRQWQ